MAPVSREVEGVECARRRAGFSREARATEPRERPARPTKARRVSCWPARWRNSGNQFISFGSWWWGEAAAEPCLVGPSNRLGGSLAPPLEARCVLFKFTRYRWFRHVVSR